MPTSLQWNFGMEDQLSPSTTFEVDYVGSRDNHMVLNYSDNSPAPDLGPVACFPGTVCERHSGFRLRLEHWVLRLQRVWM